MTAFRRLTVGLFFLFGTGLVLGLILRLNAGPRPAMLAAEHDDPWADDQVMTPQSLAKRLSASARPTVICVGFDVLYEGAHIPGSLYLGPTREPKGIEALTKWAHGMPRDKDIVLYCGCCPWSQCPNIRPAFRTLAALGFKRLRVVRIDQDFAHDWVAKGYPVKESK